MLWKYFGTFVNAAAVIIGGLLGPLIRVRMRKKRAENAKMTRQPLPETMMFCLGLCTIFAAASGLLGVQSGAQALIVVVSMVLGLLIGYALRLDDRINDLGNRVIRRFGGSDTANPGTGFVTACLLFCIGSMTVLGSFEGAMNPPDRLDLNCHTTMLIKSLLDFVSATCLSITYGASVAASALFVLASQGLLTTLSGMVQPFLTRVNALPAVYCVGSMVLIVIALNLMNIKKSKTADYLPAIFLPILICWILNLAGAAV